MGKSLSEEIKQPKFRNEYHKLSVNMIFTGNWLNGIINKFLKPYHVTPQQFNVLRILRGQSPKPVTLNLIRERMLDKMSDVSRIVERLREAGLVERVTCPSDRRAVDIRITKKGLDLLSEIDKENEKTDTLFQSLTEKEAAQLNELLDKLRN